MQYNRSLKKKLCENICFNHSSTSKIADEYNIPIKTLEKWITAFHKDNHCFDPLIQTSDSFKPVNSSEDSDYNNLTTDELKKLIMKKDIEIARLKKAYMVKGGGMEEKVFISFSKKNMK